MQGHFFTFVLLVSSLVVASAQNLTAERPEAARSRKDSVARAERFFRGVYGGKPEVIDELASDKIVISYPAFEKIYGKVALRGKDDVKVLCANFVRKWVDRKLTVRDVLVDANRVVLVWGFQARFVNEENAKPSEPVHWAGISIFCFGDGGKIEKEYGLESQPGPFSQLLAGELTANQK
jgi:hypothetical protein